MVKEKKQKKASVSKEEIEKLIEAYKNDQNSKYSVTEPIWDNWKRSSQTVELNLHDNFTISEKYTAYNLLSQ